MGLLDILYFIFRLINERESLGKELEQLIKKKDHLLRSPYSNSNEVRDIQEQIESAQATMNYIQVRASQSFQKLKFFDRFVSKFSFFVDFSRCTFSFLQIFCHVPFSDLSSIVC